MSRVSRETDGSDPGAGVAGVSRETESSHPEDAAEAVAAGGSGETGPIGRALTALFLLPIRAYRRLISPLAGPRCRYYPTCSAYAEQAIRELGPLRGSIVAAWRVVRCNPMSSGGLDPLENRRLFRSDHPRPPRDGTQQPTTR